MIHDDEPSPKPPRDDESGWGEYIAFTVVTAMLSAMASGLATWGIDELRERFGTKKPEPKS